MSTALVLAGENFHIPQARVPDVRLICIQKAPKRLPTGCVAVFGLERMARKKWRERARELCQEDGVPFFLVNGTTAIVDRLREIGASADPAATPLFADEKPAAAEDEAKDIEDDAPEDEGTEQAEEAEDAVEAANTLAIETRAASRSVKQDEALWRAHETKVREVLSKLMATTVTPFSQRRIIMELAAGVGVSQDEAEGLMHSAVYNGILNQHMHGLEARMHSRPVAPPKPWAASLVPLVVRAENHGPFAMIAEIADELKKYAEFRDEYYMPYTDSWYGQVITAARSARLITLQPDKTYVIAQNPAGVPPLTKAINYGVRLKHSRLSSGKIMAPPAPPTPAAAATAPPATTPTGPSAESASLNGHAPLLDDVDLDRLAVRHAALEYGCTPVGALKLRDKLSKDAWKEHRTGGLRSAVDAYLASPPS